MMRKHFKVAINSLPPYIDYTIKNGTLIVEGVLGDLWTFLQDKLEFSTDYILENSIAEVNFLHKDTRDILLQPNVLVPSNSNYFPLPLTEEWFEIYLKDGKGTSYSISYTKNWSNNLWICAIFSSLLLISILFLMLKMTQKISNEETSLKLHALLNKRFASDWKLMFWNIWRKSKYKKKEPIEFSNCCVNVLGVVTSQGTVIDTKFLSVRILIIFILIYGMIMSNAYSARLITQLTVGERFLPFNSLEELELKGQRYSLCVRKETYPYLILMGSNKTKEIRNSFKNIINRKPCPDKDKPTPSDICTNYIAYLETPAIMKKYLRYNKLCQMTKIAKKYFYGQISLLINRDLNRSAKHQIQKSIIKYQETGIMSKIKRKWLTQDENLKTNEKEIEVSFEQTGQVFYLYGICIAFSFLLFSMEFFFPYINSVIFKFKASFI